MATMSDAGGLYGRIAKRAALPISATGLLLCSLSLVLFLISKWKDGKGWTFKDNAFARWYGNWRFRQKGSHHAAALFYFSTYERHPMKVEAYNDRLVVFLPEETREVPYSQVYNKTFKTKDLYVIRTVSDNKAWDIILDIGSLSKEERARFLDFIQSKKPEFIKWNAFTEPWLPPQKGL